VENQVLPHSRDDIGRESDTDQGRPGAQKAIERGAIRFRNIGPGGSVRAEKAGEGGPDRRPARGSPVDLYGPRSRAVQARSECRQAEITTVVAAEEGPSCRRASYVLLAEIRQNCGRTRPQSDCPQQR
jgi:hypothetical protein